MNDTTCCVCWEDNDELLKCQHNLCNNCLKQIYILKCPMCQNNITSQFNDRIKLTRLEKINRIKSTILINFKFSFFYNLFILFYVFFIIYPIIFILIQYHELYINNNNETIKAFIYSIFLSIILILIIKIIASFFNYLIYL